MRCERLPFRCHTVSIRGLEGNLRGRPRICEACLRTSVSGLSWCEVGLIMFDLLKQQVCRKKG